MTSHEFSTAKKEPGIPVGNLEEWKLPPNQETQLFSDLDPEDLGLPPGIETVNGVINVGQDSEHKQTFAVASARNFQTGVNDTLIYKLRVSDSGELGYETGSVPLELNSQATHWFGRNPRVKRPEEPGYMIKDETGTVSRLHFGLRKDESGAVFVTDAESTNGTSLMQRKEAVEDSIERPTVTGPASERASTAVLRSTGVRPPEGMITHVPSAEELRAEAEATAEKERQDNPLSLDIQDYDRLADAYKDIVSSPPEEMPQGLTQEYELSLRTLTVLLEDGAIARHVFEDSKIRSLIDPALRPSNLPPKPQEPGEPVKERPEFPHELRNLVADVQSFENQNSSRGWVDKSRGFEEVDAVKEVANLNWLTSRAIGEILTWAVENNHPVRMDRYIAGNRNGAVSRRLNGDAPGMERWR